MCLKINEKIYDVGIANIHKLYIEQKTTGFRQVYDSILTGERKTYGPVYYNGTKRKSR